jgi:hypothetical protein
MDRERVYKWLIFGALVFTISVFAATPKDANEWFRLAQQARQGEQLREAHAALDNAEQLGFQPMRVAFERARLLTLGDEPEKAVATLQSLADGGFTAVGFITGDPILSTLAGNSAYDGLVTEMAKLAYPCESDPSFAAFDFWVGDWEVHGPAGELAGHNTIERAQRGCVLIENWTSASGGTGMSINYLDKASGEWVQVWNAEGGSQIHIRGGMTDNGMRLVGTLHSVANNTTVPFRGLWTQLEDGRVRQFFEQSTDGGETWTPWFEGFYTRNE